ncbi:MAG: 2-oxoglutarate dehydrogenase component, partial [Acetobacteraceae bacterium]|nr:2-oxoglutarate dehydrogenase component [Acetobacteraceae bacterium]
MAGIDILASAFSGANAAFLADLYARWAGDPASVDPSFADLFEAMNDEARGVLEDASGASWAPRPSFGAGEVEPAPPKAAQAGLALDAVRAATIKSLRALMLIRSHRVRGHLEARLDPLGLITPTPHTELDPKSYGFTDADLDQPIFIDNVLGRETATLREIMQILRQTYCGPIGVEFMHIQDPEQKSWIQRRMEGAPWHTALTADEKRTVLRHLTEAEGFESFCQKRYVTTKRFGLEGGEITIPALHAMIETAATQGVVEVAIGMPHRGRLNTLVNIVKKPLTALFSEFGGESFKPDDVQGSGDVKYHLGTSADVDIAGHSVHLSLQPNPSHLEAVDPVVVGKVRARQDNAGDTKKRGSVMAILMHGDAAFAGQGLVYETLAMSQLIGYRTGGTIHLIVNNQIGFTTVPAHAYSGLYCTDVAKSIQAPILHVSGDDPEAVIFCARMAAEYRMQFSSDIVLDIVCYRRHGHNETDEPAFTQPLMYKAINATRTTRTLYAEKLARDGTVSPQDAKAIWDEFTKTLEDANSAAKSYKPNKADWLEGHWAGFTPVDQQEVELTEEATAVPTDTLKQIGAALAHVPEGFNLNPKITRQLEAKAQAIGTGQGIDWATGEALAFG